MTFKIQWKLMASYLLLILVIGSVFYGYLNHTLNRHLADEIRQNLATEARLTRIIAQRDIRDMRQDAHAVAAAIAREARARATIILANGEVVGDSDVPTDQLRDVENHLNRPEVRQALAQGNGDAIRYSATVKTSMLYVAVAFKSTRGEEGVIRLALPLTALETAKGNLKTLLGASLAVALCLALLLSFVLSHLTSRSLRTIATLAAQIAKGEYHQRIPVTTRDEVGELAKVMNEMSAQIERHMERLSTEKTQLDTILRGMGEGLMVADARGKITLVNPAFLKLFSLREGVEGRHIIEIARHPALHEAYKGVIAARKERMDELNLTLGEERHVLTHWVPLMEGGDLQGIVAVFHDITDLKKLENVRRDFVANVSHELRTPVTVIKGYAEALLSGNLDEDQDRARRFMEIIYSHAERLASLIGDLLTLSQLESGNLKLDQTHIHLEQAVRHVVGLLEQKWAHKAITVDTSAMTSVPPVLADPGRLEQVIINLLDNAIKYTPHGGTITFVSRETDGTVTIGVRDSGIGIPSKDLPRIFERFYRVDAARSREEGGTGLGLSIVKHIIQLHGGAVDVDSETGKGSTFWFTLKRASGGA